MDGLFDDLIPQRPATSAADGNLFADLIPEGPPDDEGQTQPGAEASQFEDLVPKKKPELGFYSAMVPGAIAGLRSVVEGAKQSAQLANGEIPEPAAPLPAEERPLAAPFDVGSLPDKNTPAKIGYKFASGLTSGVPELAVGLGVGAGVSKLTHKPLLGLAAAAPAAGFTYALRQIAPNFAAELHTTPDDPDSAWERAVNKTTIGGVSTAAAFAAFGINPFEGELKNLAFQAFGLQPTIAVAQKGAENVVDKKPVTEGMGSAAAESTVSTIGPYAAMRPFHRAAPEAKPEAEAPPAQQPAQPPEPSTSEYQGQVPAFIKDAAEETPEPTPQSTEPKTFKINDPAAYGLNLADLPPEQAATHLRAAEDTEGTAAQLRAVLADPTLVDPDVAAKHSLPTLPEVANDTRTNELPAQPALGGEQDRGVATPPGDRAPAGAEPSGVRAPGDGIGETAGEVVRSEPPAPAPAHPEAPTGEGPGRDTADASAPEPAGDSQPVQPSLEAAADSEAAVDPAAFRKSISRATGQKGVQVFLHGEGAAYDPLTRAVTVGKDVAPSPETAQRIGGLAAEEPPPAWREAQVTATLEDGSKVQTPAGTAADILSARIKRAMAVLECLG